MLRVHSIESFGTHEGPGIRFVLFLQGCLFRCLYCHNPDTQDLNGGELMSQEKILGMIKKARPYFGKKGGFTVSGGEPLLQARNLIPFFQKLQYEGITTAVDTNGHIRNNDVKKLVELTDLFLVDVKHIDDKLHKNLTGCSNKQTLDFVKYLEDNNKPMWIRYVLVPGYTDQEDAIRKLGEKLGHYKMIERLEILPYHRLGEHKWKELGLEYKLEGVLPPTHAKVQSVKNILQEYFKKVLVR